MRIMKRDMSRGDYDGVLYAPDRSSFRLVVSPEQSFYSLQRAGLDRYGRVSWSSVATGASRAELEMQFYFAFGLRKGDPGFEDARAFFDRVHPQPQFAQRIDPVRAGGRGGVLSIGRKSGR